MEVHVAEESFRQLVILDALDEEAVMNLRRRKNVPEGAEHLSGHDVEASHVDANLEPLPRRVLHDIAALRDEARLPVIRVKRVRHIQVFGVYAMRNSLEDARLFVLLYRLVHPLVQASVGIVVRASGHPRWPFPEGLEELHASRRIVTFQRLQGLRLDVEKADEVATSVFFEGDHPCGVGEHHVDADHPGQCATAAPLQCGAATTVALAKDLRRRGQLLHKTADDVLYFPVTLDGITRHHLVHAAGRHRLLPKLHVVGTRTHLEALARAPAPEGPLARRRHLRPPPLGQRAAQPGLGLRRRCCCGRGDSAGAPGDGGCVLEALGRGDALLYLARGSNGALLELERGVLCNHAALAHLYPCLLAGVRKEAIRLQ
mmetsp:Transcript_29912/g.67414  ORF Transcript_29912/g.67414 Transcript_29912/m.67414 type:complete len:373 (-) Transcript_29912:205-1323(-)